MPNNRRIASYLLLTFGSTWSIAGIGAAAGIRTGSGMAYMVLAAACMLMPALAAVVQQRLIDKQPWGGLGLAVKQVHWGPMGLTALLGMAIIPTVLLVVHLLDPVFGLPAFGQASITSGRLLLQLEGIAEATGGTLPTATVDKLASVPAGLVLVGGLFSAVLAACTINLPFMLGEELGWRGYLYQALARWPWQRRVLFTGTVWGVWHAPLILMGHNYPAHPVAGVFMMVVFCVLAAYLFDRARRWTRSVWGPCLLHGIINGSAGLFALFAWGGHPLVGSPTGVAGFMALGALCAVVFALERVAPGRI